MRYFVLDREYTVGYYRPKNCQKVYGFDSLNDLLNWVANMCSHEGLHFTTYYQKMFFYKKIDYTGKDTDPSLKTVVKRQIATVSEEFLNTRIQHKVWKIVEMDEVPEGFRVEYEVEELISYEKPKRFLIYDEENSIVDIRNFDSIITYKIEHDSLRTSYSHYEKPFGGHRVGEKLVRHTWRGKEKFKFRQGPVPGIGHQKWYRHNWSSKHRQHMRTLKERMRTGEQKVELTDLNWYRHTDRSWKTSYKCRKQWMKNLKKGKGIYEG